MQQQDYLRRFIFEELGIRGELVSLDKSWQASKQHQQLSSEVQAQLGQALAASVLLSATIKFDGSLILQAQGSGGLKALVAQSTHDRKIRGLARSDGDVKGHLADMMGAGRLVITVKPTKGESYQGIVALTGTTLADSITTYFLQSEQLQTQVWLFANETHAVGLLLQELPKQAQIETDWERITLLANTITAEEMLSLDNETMLYRLFNEEKVRLFELEPITFECGCSQQKIETTLISLGQVELNDLLVEKGRIEVGCEFCAKQFVFSAEDISQLFV